MLLQCWGAGAPAVRLGRANVRHLARHDVSTSEAEEVILDPDAIMLEIQKEEEERVKTVGATSRGRIIEVVFTFRGEAIRPITAYTATRRAEILYTEGKRV
jgi:uncharacterized DUF497 family protein